ncbi:hypothetical protein GF327_08380 [Candidatus Woesearchaeota archaeon]|nr:hypothetical protein [Candidatus Woesearchaeota archaeon]
MKKKIIILSLILLLPLNVSAFISSSRPDFLNNSAILILGIETLFVIIISANLVKFLNITRKNKLVKFIYLTIGLFLFNSVLNLIYFISVNFGWNLDYMYIYLIERIIITTAFIMITIGFFKFNKLLRTKV